ncbi:MAG: T9SS type A sorting domain-containing protein [Chitinophagales bacterium]|nr:T9SS type A sorting domain-containing protein [Chitinophagales bacterium]
MKIILTFISSWIFCSLLYANPPEIEWQRNYGGDNVDGCMAIAESSDGYYYFMSYSASQASGDRTVARKGTQDIWIVKTTPDGHIVWDKAFGPGLITPSNMIATTDGGLVVGGNTEGGIGYDKTDTARGKLDVWLIKIDRNGNKVWDKTLGGSDHDNLGHLIETPQGDILVAINSSSPISGDRTAEYLGGTGDAWVVKLNAQGQYIWDKSYGGTGGEHFYAGFVDSEGNYLLGGYSTSPISGTKTDTSRGGIDGWLIKTDPNGNILWDKTLGGGGTDYIQTMVQTNNGNYVLGIQSESFASGDKDHDKKGCWLVKINKSGDMLWQKTIGGTGAESIRSMDIDKQDGLFMGFIATSGIVGDKTTPAYGSADYWLVKTDMNGDIQWQNSYGDASSDRLTGGVFISSDNGYVIGGSSNKWRIIDMWIIKLYPEISTGIKDINTPSALKIYPNPTHGNFVVQTPLSIGNANVTISDAGGKKVWQRDMDLRQGSIHFDLQLPQGIYLLQLTSKEGNYLQKFIIHH